MRIFYGICGEGMGHAIRSKPILDHVSKKHEITIFSSGNAKTYLSKHFSNVKEIPGLFMYYRNNAVDEVKTLLTGIVNLPRVFLAIIKMWRLLKKEQPNIVIVDYDPILSYAAYFAKIPVISIDNQHILDVAHLDLPANLFGWLETKMLNRLLMIHADKYFVVSFFFPKERKKNAWIGYPVMRKEITSLQHKAGHHILVYQTSKSNEQLIHALKEIPEPVIIYGFDKDARDKNLIYKKFDDPSFFQDLAHCKAVITNGGFSLIVEALYLGKPILSIPVKRQYEQWINAYYLKRLGFGEYVKEAKKEAIIHFLNKKTVYQRNIKKVQRFNDTSFLIQLDKCLKELSREAY